jgi:hypothetical protein
MNLNIVDDIIDVGFARIVAAFDVLFHLLSLISMCFFTIIESEESKTIIENFTGACSRQTRNDERNCKFTHYLSDIISTMLIDYLNMFVCDFYRSTSFFDCWNCSNRTLVENR